MTARPRARFIGEERDACDPGGQRRPLSCAGQLDRFATMKTFLSIILIIAASSQFSPAQTTTLTIPTIGPQPRQVNIPVLAGETLEILAWCPSQDLPNLLRVDGVSTNTGGNVPKLQGATFAGPLTVSLSIPNNESLIFTYRMTVVASVATQNIPSQTVAIPENTITPADVILESSTDLSAWTSAFPGSFTPSALKRFFRLRLVLH